MNVFKRFKNFPPILARLLAKGGQPISTCQIATASGLPKEKVEYISQQTDWSEVSLIDSLAFLKGCGLAIDDAKAWRRAMDYLSKRPTFRYLRADDNWETYYQPMLKRWAATARFASDLCPQLVDLLRRLEPVNRGAEAEIQKV